MIRKALATGCLLALVCGWCHAEGERTFDLAQARAPLFSDPIWDGAADPAPLWNRQAGEWWVYYTQRRATLQPNEGVEFCHGSAIGIAASKDGRQWRYLGTCEGDQGLSDPVANNCSWWAPGVLYHDGLYHMYVSWVDGIYKEWIGKRFIKHFTSTDGKTWAYQSTLDLSSDRCIDACVYRAGGKWCMLYKDEVHGSHSYLAQSDDLYDWAVVGPAVTDVSHEAPFVWQWQDAYWLVVDSWQRGIRVYRSQDGLKDWQYNNRGLSCSTTGPSCSTTCTTRPSIRSTAPTAPSYRPPSSNTTTARSPATEINTPASRCG
jgi:hypothetical protein